MDDDEEVRIATSAFVRSLGYAARAYGSAEAFLGSSDADRADCLIIDIQMPGMSGPELQGVMLRRARPTPIVFITAFPDADVREHVLAAGAINVLGKPCEGQALAGSIEVALSRRG